MAVLQRQPGLWAHLTALLEAGGQAGALTLPALRGGQAADAAGAAAWAEQESAAALLQAEACALQIAAAECYTWAAGGSAAAPGMPADLSAFLRKLPAELAPRLLERYCLPLPTAGLLAAAQQAAAAGGLQLLGAALSDEALWRSMAEGGGLAPQLAAAAQPLLSQFSSQGEAARVLADSAPAIAARNFAGQPSAVAIAQVRGAAARRTPCHRRLPPLLGTQFRSACAHLQTSKRSIPLPCPALQLVMRQAEVPQRLAADRELGCSFVYEPALLQRRLGGVLVSQLDQLQALSGALMGGCIQLLG